MFQLTAQQLASVHAVGDHDPNPLSGEIAFTWNEGGAPSLYLHPGKGRWVERLLRGSGHYGSWSPDGQRLVFLRDEGGKESDDVIVLHLATREEQTLTGDPFTYTWPRFGPDGRLAVISNREGSFDPYLVDPESGAFTRISTGGGAASSLAWSPDGRYIGFLRLAPAADGGNLRSGLHLYDIAKGEERQLAMLRGDLFHMEWSWRAGRTPRLCVPAERDEFLSFLLVQVDGEQEWIDLGEGDNLEPRWSPDGTMLAYLHAMRGDRLLRVWERRSGEQRDLSIGDGIHRQPRWSPDGRSLTVIYESATMPPDLWRVTLSGEPEQLTTSLPSGFPHRALAPAAHVSIESFDGLELPGLLYAPTSANGAAIVWVHGGPAGIHSNGWYPELQLLTNLGYTVLAPNMRGSGGFGKTYRELSRFDWGGGELGDLAAANGFLRERGFHHVGIMGSSLGGYLTLLAIAKQPELWTAAAVLYPIASLETLYKSTRPGDLRSYLEDHIGTPEQYPELFHDRSPLNFVEQIHAPLLILQGANDPRTPLTEAEQMAERLTAAGKVHYLHVYPNEGHGFQHRENRKDAFSRVLAFFNEHLAIR